MGWRVAHLLTPLLLLAAGCFQEPTARQRAASFGPLTDLRVDNVSLAEFTARRSCYLLATPAGDFEADRRGHIVLTNVSTGTRPVQLYTGTAVVLTRDGYLLTAAHCAAAPNLTIVAARGGHGAPVGAMRPRVVWFGKAGDPLLDLAILKVDGPFDEAFEWSADNQVTRRARVALAGIDLEKYRLGFSYAAGRVTDGAWMRSRPGATPVRAVKHSAPLRRGDSGGPLVTTDGKLAAVNVAVRFGLAPQFSVSLRPDPSWVETVIEADRTTHSGGAIVACDGLAQARR